MYNIHIIYIIYTYVYIYFSKWKSRPKDLREIFKALDANGDGFLTVTELRDGIDKAPIKTTWWILDDPGEVYWDHIAMLVIPQSSP